MLEVYSNSVSFLPRWLKKRGGLETQGHGFLGHKYSFNSRFNLIFKISRSVH